METPGSLKFILVASSLGCFLAGIGVSKLLMDIESESVLTNSTMQESITSENSENGESRADENGKSRLQKELTTVDRLVIVGTVGVLVVVNFLMLVVTGGPMWLSVLTNTAVIGIFLRPQIMDEIKRDRFDRLCAILALFLFIACKLCIATYARKALNEGNIYRGPARIIGYDDTNYSNDGEEVHRVDLEVAWGGWWGCESTKQCHGFVNGAMCESKNDRSLEKTVDDGIYFDIDGDIPEYDFNDDIYSDNSYWQQDWNSIWGDYACKNLFETYIDQVEFNADDPPGTDGWPFVNIYGNCNTCSAYIVDYYSTEHFNEIKKFNTRARNYFISALVFLAIAIGLKVKRDQAISKIEKTAIAIPEGSSSLEFEVSGAVLN